MTARDLPEWVTRAIAAGPPVRPLSVAHAINRNALRLLAIKTLCDDALAEAMDVLVPAGEASQLDSFAAMRGWACAALDELAGAPE